ncbi:MAG TPA: histidine kinase dimerization/phospho-acceptor domain-containing protein, partial [Bacteroidota bacterium]|nr:histidine kinase dimerization/phospho-acceptor domain-containing protein [Bacteroidota bacterium]
MADSVQLNDNAENRSGGTESESPRSVKKSPAMAQYQLPFAPESSTIIISDREQLRAILSSIPLLLFALDRRGVFLMFEGKATLGLSPSQRSAVGRSFFDIYPDNPESRGRLAYALDGNVVSWTEQVGDRMFTTTVTPLRDRHQLVTGVLGVAIETNAAPADSDRGDSATAAPGTTTRSMFLAQVSHEFRTPLNSIVGFANLLTKEHGPYNEQDLFYVQRIIGNATHLLGVVEDMLSLTAIDNGKIAVSLKEVDLGELIRE